ncbi:bifunctional 23S rRNA (guanine(2069)-N(7))-methyltransferase RlmK/23S rRNA (guanine(2445)-N(2))-methyltransferase RlmL [Salinicola sp. DM10]|uniref:bifunctional 23S rRNA (guanine(2069)-N(7))-methyltransferase RlmK/23S rRNA (guanine(2445)-N(2))-methyltransferase RlmL n=1 Tax=Salinicola sp. DM10 TaxID=2815721 RepID=UPI001A8E69FD|nr:bifunctional 23S rRNA (guanine(2069)-N(7))-methyltransferase RlmK/23S rRNA (guanine(2445)-N(2))-methyltransferase RlmL [Salinicola sp. DM10]MCE3026207.1 bifunctional 23S rRNA (guanine(2069)-N(7))-methyltransferase RlmK/23S rRNA (guanine(2445)-N(2))-methyltransferase RlmL [Salinicola sp. DM10]
MKDDNSLLSLYITCPWGVEPLLAEEVAELGAEIQKTTVAGLHAHADLATAYRLCLWSRLANRVILTLGRESGCDTPEAIVAAVSQLPWAEKLRDGQTLAVDFHGQSAAIRHTRFGAQVVKDGVVEALAAAGRARPQVDLGQPDVRVYANLHKGQLLVGIDLVGASLHQRGYRRDIGHAPLKENLAAALLVRAGWPARAKRGEPLVDPMCGAGTLLIEAAMMAADIAPQLSRERFGFQRLADFDPALWQTLAREAKVRADLGRRRARSRLWGFDQSPQAIAAARSNAMRAGIPALIELAGAAVKGLTPPAEASTPGLVITNPPYGERLGELPELVALYGDLGQRLKQHFGGWQLALFTGNPDLGHRLGLRAHKQYAFKNGPLDCKLLLADVAVRDADSGDSDARHSDKPGSVPSAQTPSPGDAAPLSEGARMFANRLQKNRKWLSKWLKQSGERCYRLYDADMPEYALAIDVYGHRVHVQEYAAPRSVDADKAKRRLLDALSAIPVALDVRPEQIHYKQRERQSGKAQYRKQDDSGERFVVEEGPAKLWVNLTDYLDTGLFLDHRPVRRLLRERAAGKRFLNLFCYTGTATVHAALGGASDSLSVDLSNTYLDWARDNLVLNQLDPGHHRVVRDDCFRWLETAGGSFDLIFLDPPTFSNSKKMSGTLDIQRDHVRLVELAMARLAPGGELVFSNNQQRFKLDPALSTRFAVTEITAQTFDPDFSRRANLHHCFSIRHRESR